MADAPRAQGLYDPAREHDSCGMGFIAHVRNRPSHDIIQRGLQILANLDHRGGILADVTITRTCSCHTSTLSLACCFAPRIRTGSTSHR